MMSSSSTVKFASEELIDPFLTNVDVWQTIFEVLEVKDRIRLEMTNKRLSMLMFTCWKRVTLFDSECLAGISYNQSNSSTWKDGENLSVAFFAICVNRIGDGLRSLTIRERSTYVVGCLTANLRPNLRSMGEGCPNVETINFIFVDGTLDIRLDSFSRLKTLTVSTERGDRFPSASASIFLSIPTSIEVIRGLGPKWEDRFENAAQMEGFFANRPSLKEVSLYYLYTRDGSKADMFRVIAERCPHLKSITLTYHNCIDYSGVIALDEMKELRIPILDAFLDEMEIITVCERSPLVETLELGFRFSSNLHLQSLALNAIGSLTKLRELRFHVSSRDVVAPSLVTEFVRKLSRNSGASLRHLHLNYDIPLPTAAIEALANECLKLRYVGFYVCVGEATPTSIRFLIDCIVAHPSWIHQTGEPRLEMKIYVPPDGGDEDELEAARAAFRALAARAANLPLGVQLNILVW